MHFKVSYRMQKNLPLLNFNLLYSSMKVKSPLPAQGYVVVSIENQEVCILGQSSVSHRQCAISGPLLVLWNKFLLEFSHARLFTYCLWLLLYCSGRVVKFWQRLYSPQSFQYLLSGSFTEEACWRPLFLLNFVLQCPCRTIANIFTKLEFRFLCKT